MRTSFQKESVNRKTVEGEDISFKWAGLIKAGRNLKQAMGECKFFRARVKDVERAEGRAFTGGASWNKLEMRASCSACARQQQKNHQMSYVLVCNAPF